VHGPHFTGWEVYHVEGSPADPNRIYASQTSGWFGQIIQRSDEGGKAWHQSGTPKGEPTTTARGMPKGESNKFVYHTSAATGAPLTATSTTTTRSGRGSSSASGISIHDAKVTRADVDPRRRGRITAMKGSGRSHDRPQRGWLLR
jgi:hypothetical protein